jgi:hypothetical protein
MDYTAIILNGATNPNTIHFFTDYIIREYKKAANIGLSKDEFFSGCGMVVGWLLDELERVYNYSLTVLPYFEHPEKLNKWSCKIDLQRFSNGSHTGTMTGDDVYLILKSFEEAEKAASAPAPVATSPEPEPTACADTKKPFPQCLHVTDPEALAEKIKSILQGKRPKAAAAVYWVLYDRGMISIDQPGEAWRTMTEYIGDIGSDKAFYWHFTKKPGGLDCSIEAGLIEYYSKLIFDKT